MASEILTCEPFRTLEALYASTNRLKAWPDSRKLQENAEYVFQGDQLGGQGSGEVLEKLARDATPKTLVCHDMKGGYLEDRWINGSAASESYVFYHWSMIDTFVYFSHHLVTIPPYGWINAAHRHGVKVLGTVITEWKDGVKIWAEIFKTEEEIKRFADALIEISKFYNFEGWLINVENKIDRDEVDKMKFFLNYLTEGIHRQIEGSEIIWYDSVTCEGELSWQNKLNDSNKCFFDLCDGIFLNYNWTDSGLMASRMKAMENNRIRDVYVGLDVFGRGCPGGGGLNSEYALKKIREHDLSVAIFAPGWTHEHFGPEKFEKVENLFWAQLAPYLYIHVPLYDNKTFETTFCRGAGSNFYYLGKPAACSTCSLDNTDDKRSAFYNLSAQKPQVSVPTPGLVFVKKPSTENTSESTVESNLLNKNSTEVSVELEKQENIPKELGEFYETRQEIIKIRGNTISFESKVQDAPALNYFEFCDESPFNGGGYLKLVTMDPNRYHRLFLVHIYLEEGIQVSVVYRMEDKADTSSENELTLVLGNDSGLKMINKSRTEELDHLWRRNLYVTNLKTITEMGVAFSKAGVCSLGEIVVEQKRQNGE